MEYETRYETSNGKTVRAESSVNEESTARPISEKPIQPATPTRSSVKHAGGNDNE